MSDVALAAAAIAVILLVSSVWSVLRTAARRRVTAERRAWLEQQARDEPGGAEPERPQVPAAERLRRRLADADIMLRPREWLLIQGAGAAALAGLLALLMRSALGVVVALVLVPLVAEWTVRSRLRRRRELFDAQLADTLVLLASSLRAGLSFDQSMQAVAEDSPEPMRAELQRYGKEVQLGVLPDNALENVLRRNPSVDLRIAVRAVQVQRQLGGNLPELLARVAGTIRSRVEIQSDIRAATAQARLSGFVIAVLPIVLYILLNVLNPDYFSPMTHTGLGVTLLALSAAGIVVGAYLIRRISSIRI